MGIQQRDIYCQVKGLGKVSEAMCNHDARPADHRPCWLPACTRYHWLADGWENVSNTFNFDLYLMKEFSYFFFTFGYLSSSHYIAE